MVVRPSPRVEETAHRLAPGVIEDAERVRLRLLEQRGAPSGIAPGGEPGRCREEAGQGGFGGALHAPAAAVGQRFVVQDNQACQGMLAMATLAPILKEITKDIRVGGHDRSRSHARKLQETVALAHREWERG